MTPAEILAARQRLGLTQDQLGRRLGVSSLTVSRWERGKCRPHKRFLRSLMRLKPPRVKPEAMWPSLAAMREEFSRTPDARSLRQALGVMSDAEAGLPEGALDAAALLLYRRHGKVSPTASRIDTTLATARDWAAALDRRETP